MTNLAQGRITNWKEFEEFCGNFPTKSSSAPAFAFRGHSNDSWQLEPTLHRSVPPENGFSDVLEAEQTLLEEFHRLGHLKLAPSMASQSRSMFGIWLPLMQHHGVPTRFLDWTHSPYVAAFFAVRDFSSSQPQSNTDGGLWYLNIDLLQKHHDEIVEPLLLDPSQDMNDLMASETAPKILSIGQSRWPSEREVLQQGLFTYPVNLIGKHDTALIELAAAHRGEQSVGLVTITANAKAEIRDRLSFANITSAALFPGLDGVGRYLTDSYR